MLLYRELMLKNGIRETSDLGSPPVAQGKDIILPTNSIYHYLDLDRRDFGEGDPILEKNDCKKVVVLKPPADFKSVIGISVRARSHVFQYDLAAQRFFQTHRELVKPEMGIKRLRSEPKTLLVIDYNYLLETTEFNASATQDYEEFSMVWQNVLKGVADSDRDDRQHFLMLNVPLLLPPITVLDEATKAKEMAASIVRKFHSKEAFLIWHLIMLVEGNERSFFTAIPKEVLSRVNIFWTSGRRWTMMNLGVILKWVKSPENPKGPLGIDQIKRKLLITLVAVKSSDEEVVPVDAPLATVPEAVGLSTKKTGGLYSRPTEIVSSVQPEKGRVIDHDDDSVFSTDETSEVLAEKDKKEEETLAVLEKIEASSTLEQEVAYQVYQPPEDTSPEAAVVAEAERLARIGVISAMQVKGHQKLATRYKTIKPFPKSDETLDEHRKIPKEMLDIPEEVRLAEKIDGVPDPSMMFSSLAMMDKQYIENVLSRDTAGMVLAIQKAGIAVTDYEVKRVSTLHDDYMIHTVRLKPIVGAASTFRFRVPVVKSDGTYLANGTVCRMRKQRADIPIRKVDPDRVAMTSYYSKMFIQRSMAVVSSYDKWLSRNILSLVGTKECKNAHYKDSHPKSTEVPSSYYAISTVVDSFEYKGAFFSFDYDNIETRFGDPSKMKPESKKELPFGKTPGGDLFTLDASNIVRKYRGAEETVIIGRIETMFGFDLSKEPREYAELVLFSKKIPLGVILARYMGLGTLLKTIGCESRLSKKGRRNVDGNDDEVRLRFSDEDLYVTCKTRYQRLIINGLLKYDAAIRHHSYYLYDKADVYATVMDQYEVTARHTRELDLLRKMWVDPITEGLLIDMNEPIDIPLLFLSAAKRLTTNVYHEAMDMTQMRDRGYERIPGITYSKMIESIRGFNIRPLNANAQVSINPEDVWYTLIQDESTMPVDQSNPIQELKDSEIVIFGGHGGRSATTMSPETRRYHETAKGIVSEATVDSGDAGAITYLTANPNYNSVRGTSRQIKDARGNPTRMTSTTFMLSPGIEFDD